MVFAANMVSMLGSGLNAAAVTWHILQATKSEMNLAYLVVLQTIPAMLLLPFSGVIIDREDRRRLVMLLDAGRGAVIAVVAVLALRHEVQLWHLYLMNTLVSLGFWMFWPTITALIQELTPGSEFLHANTFLMAGVQGGWLIAGSIVGFLYNHIGLGGILLIDVCTYIASFLLYFAVRKGRHVVARPDSTLERVKGMRGAVAHYIHDLKEGLHYIRLRPDVLMLGCSWSLFLGAMLTQNITTAPLSDRVLNAGAVGYGWLNGAWGTGAFLSALYAPRLIAKLSGRKAVGIAMAVLALGMFLAPHSRLLIIAAAIFLLMGSARGVGGIAISSSIMELVSGHLMGRVQNTFFFFGMLLQLFLGVLVGLAAHQWSLTAAFAMIATVYLIASVLTAVPVPRGIEQPVGVTSQPLPHNPAEAD